MWLRYRATRRKFKRLVGEIKSLRSRANALEVENQRLEDELKFVHAERYERELRLVDRILVSKDKFAITDEVRYTVESRDEVVQERKFNEEQEEYLQKKKAELYEDAKEAGESPAAAERLYQFQEQSFIEAFQSANKFE
jgi:predicted nuclease with TOPRIM domain